MIDEFAESEWDALIGERMRWANLQVTIEELVEENKSLVRILSKYDPTTTIPLLAGLLTLPEYQSHCTRLEILAALAMLHCRGGKKASISDISDWFFQLGKSQSVASEDPAEEVFVSLVRDNDGDYRLIEGVWEGAGFYTQRVWDVIATMPDKGKFLSIKRSVHALLVVSDIVCEKAGLYRYQLGSEELHSALSPNTLPGRASLISCVTIALSELDGYGVTSDDIEHFILRPEMRNDVFAQQVGNSDLERRPLILLDESHLTVALPSALSVALRSFAIVSVIENGLMEAFDIKLAQNYSKLFSEVPLLGGPLGAPIHWRKTDTHRWANTYLKVDEGYVISFYFFLPSVQIHLDGGFKDFSPTAETLVEALQASINKTLEHFEERHDFKKGVVILVGCGWGKGYSFEAPRPDHSDWRLVSLSAADLMRLSMLADMSPDYFWRVQDGLEAVRKAGVKIVNPNGALNLIGWVRSNEGHLVPHELLPQNEISLERPLVIHPPFNLLREVRADADHSFDRHSAIDNVGTWHSVQHASPNPLFSSESARRMYVSMDDLRSGTLTSVYEGQLTLWMSVIAPNMSQMNVQYQLWEMASEWLHRVGSVLDQRSEVAHGTANLKVYVEFRDGNLPETGGDKPALEDVPRLCAVEPHSELNACKVIFESGFLAACRIANNVAERFVVRMLAQAYLHLQGTSDCEREAEEVEAIVVSNDDARNFHMFHAQNFIDYVRDTLPKKLVSVDPIDDAAAKIGLAWRVLEPGPGRKIEGREVCTDFLRKIVDALLAEIFRMLGGLDRSSTLRRLIANCEKASAEKSHWGQTSAAILGLHGDEKDTAKRYVEQLSKFSGTIIASSVLTEMALCACPLEGGGRLSNIELSKLIARAALVVRIGGLSDAIFYNVLVPEITISPLGDILFQDELGRTVVNPMLSRVAEERFVSSAPLQKKNYEEPKVIPEIKGEISDEFWDAWVVEMGFSLDEARNIIGHLEDKGIEDHAAIFALKQSECLTLVCSEEVSKKAAKKFLEQFSLPTRSSWDQLPDGFELKDIYPWRFGRRLSFATRPILKMDNKDDPTLIVAPGALRKGFVYVFDGAYRGRFGQSFFRSKEMGRTWWSKASEGHSFNMEVAESLSRAGWEIRENIRLPELLNRKTKSDLGDVDVLAWRPDRKEILAIECKDISLARNYSEIAALLSDYQGAEFRGKADKLKKHLNRIELLNQNLDQVERFTGIEGPNVVSCLICSEIVPMQFANIEALAGTFVGRISDLLEREPVGDGACKAE